MTRVHIFLDSDESTYFLFLLFLREKSFPWFRMSQSVTLLPPGWEFSLVGIFSTFKSRVQQNHQLLRLLLFLFFECPSFPRKYQLIMASRGRSPRFPSIFCSQIKNPGAPPNIILPWCTMSTKPKYCTIFGSADLSASASYETTQE